MIQYALLKVYMIRTNQKGVFAVYVDNEGVMIPLRKHAYIQIDRKFHLQKLKIFR